MGKAARTAHRAVRKRNEAEFGVFCPGVLEVLSIGKGDLKITVDSSNPQEREKARRLIEEMLSKGYGIYVETGGVLVKVKRFNPKRFTYVIVDEPAPIEAASAEPTPIKKPSKKAAAKKATREIPVAGSRATAVGRTAGG